MQIFLRTRSTCWQHHLSVSSVERSQIFVNENETKAFTVVKWFFWKNIKFRKQKMGMSVVNERVAARIRMKITEKVKRKFDENTSHGGIHDSVVL